MSPLVRAMLANRFNVDESLLILAELDEPWACGSVVHNQHAWGHADGPITHFIDLPCGASFLLCNSAANNLLRIQANGGRGPYECLSGCQEFHIINQIVITPRGDI